MHASLARTEHRPWPLPRGPWVMAQRWHELCFLHRPVPAEAVAATLPAGLEVDTFDGRAWVGVVPFRMSGVRLRATPALPWLSAFPELNVRTYVRRGDRPGVWFYSLDAANPVAVAIARGWFRLPYFRARMRCEREGEDGTVRYSSRRTHAGAPPGELVARYRPTGPPREPAPGTLEHFLTERYRLFAPGPRGALLRADVHHVPWPLQPAELDLERESMAAAAGLALPDVPWLLHYSELQEVVVWPPERC